MSIYSVQPSLPYLSNPLIVALDIDDEVKARRMAADLAEIAGGFKLGPRLLLRTGGKLVRDLAEHSSVFVDCKFFDIPSTMLSSVRTCFEFGASLVTVHAMAGREALIALSHLETELNQIRPFKILCVSVLTSWDVSSVPPNFQKKSIGEHVESLVGLAQQSGLNGIVCSPEELDILKNKGLYIVTPGIRFTLQEKKDQKRVMSPEEAMGLGASAVVVGRPIVEAANPVEAALDFQVAIVKGRRK